MNFKIHFVSLANLKHLKHKRETEIIGVSIFTDRPQRDKQTQTLLYRYDTAA